MMNFLKRVSKTIAVLSVLLSLAVSAEAKTYTVGQVTLEGPSIQWNGLQATVTYCLDYTGEPQGACLQVSLLDSAGRPIYHFTPFSFRKGQYDHELTILFGAGTGRNDASYQIRAVVSEPSGEKRVITNQIQVPVSLSVQMDSGMMKNRNGRPSYRVSLQYQCGTGAVVTCALYADDGDCIRELKKEVSSGSGSVSFQIEGTAGRELESGDYLVCYEIADASGKKAKGSQKVTLSVPTR